MNTIVRILLVCCGLTILNSCRKDKLNHTMDHSAPWDSAALSNIRIINSPEYLNVVANGKDTLTTWAFNRLVSASTFYVQPYANIWSIGPSKYFLQSGQLGRTWRVPQSLFDQKGHLQLTFDLLEGFPDPDTNPVYGLPDSISIQQGAQPMDYYLGYLYYNNSYYLAAKRDETPPSRRDYFKIRVINRADDIAFTGNASGNMQDLWGPVTLTYADGTPVSQTTSYVGESVASDYVELPYGKYQFRLLSATGWLIPGGDGTAVIDPPTASEDMGNFTGNYQVYAPILSFQPGASYTIIVYPNKFGYVTQGAVYPIYQNAFRIIKDNGYSMPNTGFCRTQCVNALPGQDNLDFRLDGTHGIRDIAYGKASDYVDLNAPDSMKVEAVDKNGRVLASMSYPVQANQNYTAYVYPDMAGVPQLAVVANDLSGDAEVTNHGQDMGGTWLTPDFMPFSKKFLNFCPDIPYATFTLGDGSPTGRAESDNLQPGLPYPDYPWYNEKKPDNPFGIMVYRSAPNKVPGTWADDIAELHGQDFIANKDLYRNFNGNLPVQEPGFYTIALIGRTGPNVPPSQQAKMIVIKHNK